MARQLTVTCDYCNQPGALETIVRLDHVIPGEPGKKSKRDNHGTAPLGDLCPNCRDAAWLALANVVTGIRDRTVDLPKLRDEDGNALQHEIDHGMKPTGNPPMDYQQSLALGGTHEDSGPDGDEIGTASGGYQEDPAEPYVRQDEPNPVQSTRKRDRKQPAAG